MSTNGYFGYKQAFFLSVLFNGALVIVGTAVFSLLQISEVPNQPTTFRVDMANYTVQQTNLSATGGATATVQNMTAGGAGGKMNANATTAASNNQVMGNTIADAFGNIDTNVSSGNASVSDGAVTNSGGTSAPSYGSSGASSGATGGGAGAGQNTDGGGTSGGTSDGTANGYVNIDAYIARLNAQAANSYPSQARRQSRQGTAVFSVTFDEHGNVTNIVMRRSSGTPSLDDAAERQIRFGGPIENTTGATTEQVVTIRYVL